MSLHGLPKARHVCHWGKKSNKQKTMQCGQTITLTEKQNIYLVLVLLVYKRMFLVQILNQIKQLKLAQLSLINKKCRLKIKK